MSKGLKSVAIVKCIIILVVFGFLATIINSVDGLYNINRLHNNSNAIIDDKLAYLVKIGDTKETLMKMKLTAAKIVYSQKFNEQFNGAFFQNKIVIQGFIKDSKARALNSKEKNLINKFNSSFHQYVDKWTEVGGIIKNNEPLSTDEFNSYVSSADAFAADLSNIETYEMKLTTALKNQNTDVYNQSLLFIFSILGIFLIIISFFSRSIIKSVRSNTNKYINDLNKIAEGDFTVQIHTDSKSEFGFMYQALQKAVASIVDIIQTVKHNSSRIESHAQELSAISEEMTSSISEVSTAMNQVSSGSTDQAEDLANITKYMNHFGKMITEIGSNLKEVETTTSGISTKADSSNTSMRRLNQSIGEMTNSLKNISSKIIGLGVEISNINKITEVINSIAEQTNLLALNASIEAARAGEAGRGFSVVADEIRKLAEQSKISSNNINTLLNKVSADTQLVTENANVVNETLNNQVEIIDTSIHSFKEIIEEISKALPRIQQLNRNIDGIEKEKNVILEKISNASLVAEGNCASAEEISASTEEMNESAIEVSKSASEMNDMTQEMSNAINQFKI